MSEYDNAHILTVVDYATVQLSDKSYDSVADHFADLGNMINKKGGNSEQKKGGVAHRKIKLNDQFPEVKKKINRDFRLFSVVDKNATPEPVTKCNQLPSHPVSCPLLHLRKKAKTALLSQNGLRNSFCNPQTS